MSKQTRNRCIQCVPPFILINSSSRSLFSQKNQQWCVNCRGLAGRAVMTWPQGRGGAGHRPHVTRGSLLGFTSTSNWTLTSVCSPCQFVGEEAEIWESYSIPGHTTNKKQSQDSNPIPGVSKIHLFPSQDNWASEEERDTHVTLSSQQVTPTSGCIPAL